MAIELPALPYGKDALAPHMSEETLEFHYGKHHKKYVDTTNKLIQGTEFENAELEDIVLQSTGELFNNAAQVWNHNFFWQCLSPDGAREPHGALKHELEKSFGSIEEFQKKFAEAAVKQFGSGWAWLVKNQNGKLEITTTSNAENPLSKGQQPLLTCDVWEHAYYIDYRNERPKFLEAFWKLANWEFVDAQLGKPFSATHKSFAASATNSLSREASKSLSREAQGPRGQSGFEKRAP